MKLSVILPTYNGMKYLNKALDSALSQDLHDWELLISDDGSTDGTREFLSGINDPRVKVFFQSTNLGIFGNLNFLLSLASGDITQIFCQDDYFVDNAAFDRLLNCWSSLAPDIAFLRCNYGAEQFSNMQRFQATAIPPLIGPEFSDVLFFVFGCVPGNLSNMSIRTQIAKDAGCFRTDLPYAGDYEFWSRVGHTRPWAVSRTVISHIRIHDGRGSVQLNKHGELLPQVRTILETLYGNLVRKGFSPELLRLMATVYHISYLRDGGVRRALRGEGLGYLRGIYNQLDLSCFSLGPFMGWAVYFASLGGRIFSVPVAKHFLRKAGIRR
jgi:glycosyltransferase involved in cell wall biosynthesis